MPFLRCILLCLSALLFPLSGGADAVIRANPSMGEINLDESLYTYQSDDSLSLTKELGNNFFSRFQPYDKPSYKFGYSTQWHWLSFTLEHHDDELRRYFLVTQSAFIQEYDFFLVDLATNKIIKTIHTGTHRPFANRDIQNRFFVFSFPMQPHSTYRIYTRVHNAGGNLIQPVRLFTGNGFHEFQQTNNIFIAGVLAFLLLGCLVSFSLWINFFERIFAYYALYLFCIFLYLGSYEGYTYQYLWRDVPLLADVSRMFYLPSVLLMFVFVYKVLWTEADKLVNTKRIGTVIICMVGILALVCSIPGHLFPYRNYVTMFLNLFVMSIMLLTMYMMALKLRQRYKPAYLLTLAFLPGIVYGLIMISNYWGLISINRKSNFLQYGLSICTLSEMGILLWMLLFRFRNIQRLQKLSAERMRLYRRLASKNGDDTDKELLSYTNSKYDKVEIEELYGRIKNLMEKDKPYLDTQLHLHRLAQLLDCHPNMLSQCINQMEGRNFNDFINQYRLALVMKMLFDERYASFSVEGIGMEAGFSSKSTFYPAFKKHTGKTPTEYRKAHKKESL